MTITAITTTTTTPSSLTSTTSTRQTLTLSASLERVLSKCQKAASDHLARGKAMGLGPVKRRTFKELQHALVLQYNNAKLDPNMTMTKRIKWPARVNARQSSYLSFFLHKCIFGLNFSPH